MNNLQELINIAIASGMATIYFTLGFLAAMVAEGIGAVISMYIERYKENKLHPKKLCITIDLSKLPNNVFRYHQLIRNRSRFDWEDYIYSSLEDNFSYTHSDADLLEMARIDEGRKL